MYPPVALRYLGVFGLAALFLLALLELQIIEAAYHKLGMSHRAIVTLLLVTILGSYINIPVSSTPAAQLVHDQEVVVNGIAYIVPQVVQVGRTVIAINVGGALIPALLSIYLLLRVGGAIQALVATTIVSVVVYHFSKPVPGVGITVPTLIPGVLSRFAGRRARLASFRCHRLRRWNDGLPSRRRRIQSRHCRADACAGRLNRRSRHFRRCVPVGPHCGSVGLRCRSPRTHAL